MIAMMITGKVISSYQWKWTKGFCLGTKRNGNERFRSVQVTCFISKTNEKARKRGGGIENSLQRVVVDSWKFLGSEVLGISFILLCPVTFCGGI